MNRPRIDIVPTGTDRLLDVAAWLLVVTIWILVAVNYDSLPDEIPTHFDLRGRADAYGDKSTIWGVPAIATLLVIMLSFFQRMPHRFNYPVDITAENAERQYTIALRMMRVLKLVVAAIFMLIVWSSVRDAGSSNELGGWVIAVTLMLVFIPMIYFISKSMRAR